MDLQLKAKVVLVTGGAKGIGAAIVRASAAEGAIPVFLDHDVEAGQQLQSALLSASKECEFIAGEITAPQTCSKTVEQVLQKFGRLDALVNNVGANDNVSLEHGTPEKFVASLELNLVHYYAMAHHALPMLKKSSGSIVNISSKTAVTGQGGTSGYVAGENYFQDSTRETHDQARRNRGHGSLSHLGASQPHHRAACIRGRRLHAPGPGIDVTGGG